MINRDKLGCIIGGMVPIGIFLIFEVIIAISALRGSNSHKEETLVHVVLPGGRVEDKYVPDSLFVGKNAYFLLKKNAHKKGCIYRNMTNSDLIKYSVLYSQKGMNKSYPCVGERLKHGDFFYWKETGIMTDMSYQLFSQPPSVMTIRGSRIDNIFCYFIDYPENVPDYVIFK